MTPIDSTVINALVQAAGLAIIAGIQKNADLKREAAKEDTKRNRNSEAEWRAEVDCRMEKLEKTLDSVLLSQLTQMRGDIIHKTHRYLDDLGCASIEEKNAYDVEYQEYTRLCDKHGIKNGLIEALYEQVMALPGRSTEPKEE